MDNHEELNSITENAQGAEWESLTKYPDFSTFRNTEPVQ